MYLVLNMYTLLWQWYHKSVSNTCLISFNYVRRFAESSTWESSRKCPYSVSRTLIVVTVWILNVPRGPCVKRLSQQFELLWEGVEVGPRSRGSDPSKECCSSGALCLSFASHYHEVKAFSAIASIVSVCTATLTQTQSNCSHSHKRPPAWLSQVSISKALMSHGRFTQCFKSWSAPLRKMARMGSLGSRGDAWD